MHTKQFTAAGKEINAASKVLLMIHGRGGRAEDMLGLAAQLQVDDYALIGPQATNHSWYPYSFLTQPSQNEPWLSSALAMLQEIINDLEKSGIMPGNIYWVGFSQGACLALEFVARHARRYGGIAAFTGGLIGDRIYRENYQGDFAGTPVFIGTSDPDPHVPVERVHASAVILTDMNARVTKQIYKNMGHTINGDEIDAANNIIFSGG